jgi:hypothetical protein
MQENTNLHEWVEDSTTAGALDGIVADGRQVGTLLQRRVQRRHRHDLNQEKRSEVKGKKGH